MGRLALAGARMAAVPLAVPRNYSASEKLNLCAVLFINVVLSRHRQLKVAGNAGSPRFNLGTPSRKICTSAARGDECVPSIMQRPK